MYLIAGLGNPGKEYEGTRHNVGFETIDKLSSKLDIEISRKKFKGLVGEGFSDGEKIILLKPLTYMNLSGESIGEAVSFYNIPVSNVIVIYDDIYIDVGRIRVRASGSDGGHNGMKSIIFNLQSKDFPRIRVGTGAPDSDLVSYVLGKFKGDDAENVKKAQEAAGEAAIEIIKNGVQSAMNRYNCFNACQE